MFILLVCKLPKRNMLATRICREWCIKPTSSQAITFFHPVHLHCIRNARGIIKDACYPGHSLFFLLPFGRRQRCLKAQMSKVKKCFFSTIRSESIIYFILPQVLPCNLILNYAQSSYFHYCTIIFFVLQGTLYCTKGLAHSAIMHLSMYLVVSIIIMYSVYSMNFMQTRKSISNC